MVAIKGVRKEEVVGHIYILPLSLFLFDLGSSHFKSGNG